MPSDWKTGLVVKLPKKLDISMCNNWRGITLLYVTSNVFSRVILDRISAAIDPLMCKQQAGFQKGRYCVNHIFTLRQIMEQCQERNTRVYANVVDFEKVSIAFTQSLWCILRHSGILPRL